MYTGAMEPF